MRDDYRILASDRDELKRSRRKTQWTVAITLFLSMLLFAYPLLKEYKASIRALKTARKLSGYLNDMKTKAILSRTPLEVRFLYPDRIETYQVNSCGPNNDAQKLEETTLAKFYSGVVFVPEDWIKAHLQTSTVMLRKFCYDPIFGSSVHADGLVYGSVFLMDSQELSKNEFSESDYFEALIEMQIRGETGDIQIQ